MFLKNLLNISSIQETACILTDQILKKHLLIIESACEDNNLTPEALYSCKLISALKMFRSSNPLYKELDLDNDYFWKITKELNLSQFNEIELKAIAAKVTFARESNKITLSGPIGFDIINDENVNVEI